MNPKAVNLFRVFLPFAAGYFLSFLYRTVNAVLAPALLRDLGLSSSSLGLLTATYFIAFASFQLPLGVLLDRFGPRRIEALLLLVAALGAFCFSRADSLAQLILGRALIGLGVSACLMAAFKAYTQWFAAEKWPLVNGLQMAAGGLGALAATTPVQWMLRWTDWRGVFFGLAMFTLLVAALVLWVVPEKRVSGAGERFSDQLRGIGEVFTSPEFWRVAPLTALSQATFFAVQGLWAGPWLKDVLQLNPEAVVNMLFWIAVAMVAGFIGLGSLAGRLQRVGIPVLTSAIAGMTLFIAIQMVLIVGPSEWARVLWLGFGFFGTSGILAYAALAQSFPVHLVGRVSTAVNLLVFIAAFAGQWAIGVIVGWWPEVAKGQFASAGLRTGLTFLLVCQLGALLWFFGGGRRRRAKQRAPAAG
ncbi:MAG: MFS transporter [Desulfobulbaceae bacterium]|nr:MFS transporter [Desulfobulbaceae bacterium]